VAISKTAAPARKSIPIHAQGINLRLSHIPCFDDWKRFCFVLREIASGDNSRPLSALEAQKRAQAMLIEYGYTWPSRSRGAHLMASPCSPQLTLMPERTGRPKP
jgi:hypothetical protein